MYAVIVTGGKQLKVEVGSTIYVEKLKGEKGDSVKFDKVLFVSDEKKIKVGNLLPALFFGAVYALIFP